MLDQRAAARLLASARSIRHLAPLARAAGFGGELLRLDDAAMRRIGIDGLVRSAAVIAGAGSLRALLIDLNGFADSPDDISTLATRLTRHAPGQLWLLLATGDDLTTLATWSGDRARPRVAALRVDPRRVLPSDGETVTRLAAAAGGDDLLVHARWLDILGRDALTARFYRALESLVRRMAAESPASVPPGERRAIALLDVSRLLFLAFLETKGLLNGDPRFLARAFERCMSEGGGFHRRVLNPLFFGTLNTPLPARAPAARAFGQVPFLNGGLFARGPLEKRHRCTFSDDAFGAVFDDLLLRYRFTPREEQPAWSEAAVDPEMLGRAFESLMASDARRTNGTFYTPQALVAKLVDRGLCVALRGDGVGDDDIACALAGDAVRGHAADALRRRLSSITIVDPACGSGAFLVYALERVAAMLSHLEGHRASSHRRAVLARSIFGVDVDATAVWLCQLRLWLAVVTDHHAPDLGRLDPLPNLDQHIRVGDSLAGELPDSAWRQPGGASIARLRMRYARTSGANKRTAARILERAERARRIGRVEAECAAACAARRDVAARLRGRDLFGERAEVTPDDHRLLATLRSRVRALRTELRRLRDGAALPFAWSVHTGDVLDAGGFDLIVGNPPWVRLHRIPPRARDEMRARFVVFRQGGWARGRDAARAGHGFASQVDLAALFVERSLGLARRGGAVALLLPSKLWRSLAGGGVRRLLQSRAALELLEDWGAARTSFDAAVYPSGIVAAADPPTEPHRATQSLDIVVHDHHGSRSWRTSPCALPAVPNDEAAPWLLLPPEARAAFERLRSHGVALADSALGVPLLGVKTGCNEAFVVRAVERRGDRCRVTNGVHTGSVPAATLRPLLRGDTLGAAEAPDDEHIVWTHGDDGAPLPRLAGDVARWLEPYEHRLRRRGDLRPGMPWWSLFRTPSARHERARVVWADVAREPRVRVLAPGDRTVALNSCYVMPCADALDATALASLLRSPVCVAWMRAVAEPARGGYHRWLGWTVALLPIPRDWTRARRSLARIPVGASGWECSRAVARAFEIPLDEITALIEWGIR